MTAGDINFTCVQRKGFSLGIRNTAPILVYNVRIYVRIYTYYQVRYVF